MPIYQAIILGIVQGLTEFLPISSSGHLVLVPWLFGWEEHSLTFDVALHLGTLLAVLVYFRQDLWTLLLAWLSSIKHRSFNSLNAKLAWMLLVATIPAAALGFLTDDWIEQNTRQPLLVGVLVLLFGLVMWVVDKYGHKDHELSALRWRDSLWVGAAQALALFPGVSRSGATITAGLWRGLTRESAARFSFLLAVPVMSGAIIFKLSDLVRDGVPTDEQAAFASGIFAAAVTGFIAIGWLLKYLRTKPLTIFVVYRLVLGLLIIALALMS